MKKRKLGKIEVSEIGMGCMGLSHGYGAVPDEEYSVEAIRRAYEYGCTFFDTAEVYGPNMLPENQGHNEKIVGKALKDVRDNVVIATKMHLTTEEARADGIAQTVRNHLLRSLERLQTERVELYYLHRLNRELPLEEIAGAFAKLHEEGLILGWGLSQVGVETIRDAHAVFPLSAIQNIYSMLERSSEEDVVPFCIEHEIGFVPFSPIASGFLSGKVQIGADFSHSDDVRKYVPQLSDENMKGNQPVLELLAATAQEKNATMAQISLAWMLHKYPNLAPIPGSKNQERILENLRASEVSLSDDEFARLDDALRAIPIHGFRGHVERQGGSIKDWGRNAEKR